MPRMSLAPSSYPRDAYSYAVNQSGHAYLVGVPAAQAVLLALGAWRRRG